MDADVEALCAEVWAWRLEESPELATFCGFHHLDDRLDDISEEAYIKREVGWASFVVNQHQQMQKTTNTHTHIVLNVSKADV